MSNVFIAFLLCAFVALFTWILCEERHEEEVSHFKKELSTLTDKLSWMSDERRILQERVAELDYQFRRYENVLERVEEDTRL